MKIKKVVFPVAGLGTRFLPATKTVAKEMLPILDKPLIQYAVDEAVAAGCDTLVFVTNRYKHAIADYFDTAYELEAKLLQAGKHELLESVRSTVPRGVNTIFVTQREALGLGHAVLCAEPVVRDEPFAVILPDDLIWNREQGALQQMIAVATQTQASVIAVEEVPPEDTARYGIVSLQSNQSDSTRYSLMQAVVEKPKPEHAPSNLAIVGRYVLDNRIFELLRNTKPGAGGEIQLTDAIASLINEKPVVAYRFEGQRFDCGTRVGAAEATLRLALEEPDLRASVLRWMHEITDRDN